MERTLLRNNVTMMALKKPLQSFLETLSAAFLGLHVYFLIVPSLLLYIALFTRHWPVVLLAVFWTLYDRETPHRGGRRLNLVTYFPLWRYLNNYFPVTLIKTVDLNPRKNYLFCLHPHGILAFSCIANFLNGYSVAKDLFPGFKFYMATVNFTYHIPMFRDYWLGLGSVSASWKSLMFLLNDSQRGNIVNLMVGGLSEIALTKRGNYRFVLKKRKGFIKATLMTGCYLVPVICFGENDILDMENPRHDSYFSRLVKKWIGFDIRLPGGRSWLMKFVPRRLPLVTLVGKPLDIPKVAEPSEEEINHYHALYIEELIKLFNEHKHKYVEDPDNTELTIVE